MSNPTPEEVQAAIARLNRDIELDEYFSMDRTLKHQRNRDAKLLISALTSERTARESAEQRVAELERDLEVERKAGSACRDTKDEKCREVIVLCTKLAAAERQVAALREATAPIMAMRPDGDIGWRGQRNAKCGWVLVKHILALEAALAAPSPEEKGTM